MASILKVDTIQDQSGNNIINENADTITIGASGDTVTIPSGATISNLGTASGFVNAGQIIQVVSSNEDGSISTSSQTYVTTSQSLSITPSSASNTILVLFDCGVSTLAANTSIDIDIRRAGTSIALCGMYTATVSGNLSTMGGTSVLDSPNTTSATTYEVFYKEGSLAGTVNLYRRRLHLLEVKG
jgi:hypothetical protein